jgi:aspartate ammonia-lyase
MKSPQSSRHCGDIVQHERERGDGELGYETTTEIAKDALETGCGVYELVCERGLMTRDQLDRLLNPAAMTAARRTE